MRTSRFALPTLLLALCGCSSIPGATTPRAVSAPGDALELRLCVLPPEVALASDEQPKGYLPGEVIDGELVSREVTEWLRADGRFASVRASRLSAPEAAAEAWEQEEDLLVRLRLRDFRASYDGHNGWWIPNIVNWLFWLVPAWFVATEEYSVSFAADLELISVATGAQVHTATLPISVGGSFDEFDRGWQLLGFIAPFNDADNWRQVAAALLPAARSALGSAVASELATGFVPRAERGETARDMAKTLALLIGISHYQATVDLPPLSYAAEDAQQVAAALGEVGVAPLQATTLIGSGATRPAVDAALAELARRMRPDDQLLIYFAGYGTRGADGRAQLLLYDADPQAAEAGALTLEQLAAALRPIPGRKLVAIDASFDGLGRSIRGGEQAKGDDLAAFEGVTVLLGTSPGHPLKAPEHTRAGLFTHHLVQGLRGGADRDGDGRLTPEELFFLAHEQTVADGAYYGDHQQPQAANLDAPFVLSRVGGAGGS